MKKPLKSSKSFWQDDTVLKITDQRRWIEYLVKKKRAEYEKFSSKLMRILKKIF